MKKRSNAEYMKLALELAARARDRTYPNPMVGAVIVKGSRIVGIGYHRRAGSDHAEVAAIKGSDGACSGGTMFVTLEPCDHYGRTPPCTRAIAAGGIKKVYIAMKDPNPLNSGRGIRRLRGSGIKVETGLCADEAALINRKYIKFITKGLPYVTVKLAQSADGKIAARDGSSKWISSDISRRRARRMRRKFDAIVVGSNTVVRDDPILLDEKGGGCGVSRVIVDTRLKTPLASNIVRTAEKAPVIIGTTELAPASKLAGFRKIKGVDVLVVKSKREKVPLKTLFASLARRGMVNILVEGGGELAGNIMDESLADEIMLFIAPKILGGRYSSIGGRGVRNIADAIGLRNTQVKRSGEDILITGLLCSRG